MPTDISVVINPPEQVSATLQTNPNQIDLTVNQFGDVPPHATTHAPNGSDSLGAYYITGDVVRPSETGSFITTGQTGQFATTGQLSFSNTEVITGDTTLAANKSYLVRIPPGSPSSTLNVYLPPNPQSGNFIELQTEFLESGWGFAKGLNINANGNLATGWQNAISWTGDFSIFAPLQAPLFADLVYNGSAWIYTYKGPDLQSFGRFYGGSGFLLTIGGNYKISSVNSGIFAAASQTGQFIITGQTGQFVGTGSTGSFITSSQTGQFVWTGSTGNFITGSVVRPSETGSFLTTSQTGSFISTSQTGGFVGTGQTGFYTGVFYPYSSNPNGYVQGAVVRPSQTGQFVGTGQTGSLVSTVNNQTISGIKTFYSGILISPSGGSDTNSFAIKNIPEPSNPSVNALFIVPTEGGRRLFLGQAGASIYAVNFSNVYTFEEFPGILQPSADFTILMKYGTNLYLRHIPSQGSAILPMLADEENTTPYDGYFNLLANSRNTGSGSALVINTKYSKTGGNLFEARVTGANRFTVDVSGNISGNGASFRQRPTVNNAQVALTGDLIDYVSIANASHGDIIYRGASSWVRLPAGTSGQFLKTNGSGANPVWASIP